MLISHKRFRILGYVYAILGAFCTFYDAVEKVLYNVEKNTHNFGYYIVPALDFIVMIFFMILLAGIRMNNQTLVKIYRVFHHVFYGLTIGFITIPLLGLTGMKIFTEKHVAPIFIEALFMAFIVFIGLYVIFWWVVNGMLSSTNRDHLLQYIISQKLVIS